MSKKTACRKSKAKIAQRLHRQYPDAPDDVVSAEAMTRMLARTLLKRETDSIHAAVAQVVG